MDSRTSKMTLSEGAFLNFIPTCLPLRLYPKLDLMSIQWWITAYEVKRSTGCLSYHYLLDLSMFNFLSQPTGSATNKHGDQLVATVLRMVLEPL